MGLRPAVAQQLVPASLRPAAIFISCTAAAVVATLGALFAHHMRPGALDNAVSNFLGWGGTFGPGGYRGPDFLLAPLRLAGSTLPLTLLTALLVCRCLALRRYRGAVMLAASVVFASALSELVLKPIIGRTRYGSLSYPSGHATAIFAIAAAIVILLIRSPTTNMAGSTRVVLAVLTLGAAVASALGLVVIHYFTDIIGGAAAGVAVTLSAALILDRLNFPREQALAQAERTAEPARTG